MMGCHLYSHPNSQPRLGGLISGAFFTHSFLGSTGLDIQQISTFFWIKSCFCGQVRDMVSPQVPPLFLVKGAAPFVWCLGQLQKAQTAFPGQEKDVLFIHWAA